MCEEKNASWRPAALDLCKIKVCVFCVSGDEEQGRVDRTSDQKIQLISCF